jgi:6-phosphogluconolactonase
MEIISGTKEELYIQAAAKIAERITLTLAQKGKCVLGVAGGRSMPPLFEKLLPYGRNFKGELHIFWLDERIGPEKNFAPLLPYLNQFHREGVTMSWHPLQSMHLQQAEVESRQMELLLREQGMHFDIIIASAGEDGHIASLFPNSHLLKLRHLGYAIEEHAPKPPLHRITVTPQLLTCAGAAYLFFVDKHEAYELFLRQGDSAQCPARMLVPLQDLAVYTTL